MNVLSTGQVAAFLAVDLVVIIATARLVGALFVRLGQPRVVGEIVAGILLGPTLLGPALWGDFSAPGWLHCVESLTAAPSSAAQSPTWCLFPAQARTVIGWIGRFALLSFMFLTGLEVEPGLLKGRSKVIALVGIGVVALPLAMGFVIGPVMSTDVFKPPAASPLGFTLFIGAILAVTAFPVAVRILQERGLTTTVMGATAIAAAAVCTVVMFLAAATASALAHNQAIAALAIGLLLSLGYLATMLYVVRPLMAGRFMFGSHLNARLVVVAALVMLVSGYVADRLGLTVIVGGFMAGLIMPARERLRTAIGDRAAAFTGSILLPVFLAFSGLGTDFTKLSVAALGGIAVLLVGGIVSKWLGGAVLGRLGGLTWADGNVLGILMNCRGLLVLVVALEGIEAGVITPVAQIGAVVMALVTTAMTGPLLNVFATAPGPVGVAQPAPNEGPA